MWFYLGLFSLLLGILLDSYIDRLNGGWLYLAQIGIELLKNIGIAILVANVFSFIIGTQQFIDFIRDKLINIVISKNFIEKLNRDERKDMLKSILKPSKELSSIYSGITRYFDRYIEDSLNLFKLHYRSGFTLIGDVCFDKEANKVKGKIDFNYRIYKVMGEYEKLPIAFENDDCKLIYTKITTENGEEKVIDKTELIDKMNMEGCENIKNDPCIKEGATQIIPEEFKKYTQLDILRRIEEMGADHWYLFSYRANYPCDKLTIQFKCEEGIEVKNCIIYGKGEHFKIENEISKITVYCNDWLRPGYGVSILFARKEAEITS